MRYKRLKAYLMALFIGLAFLSMLSLFLLTNVMTINNYQDIKTYQQVLIIGFALFMILIFIFRTKQTENIESITIKEIKEVAKALDQGHYKMIGLRYADLEMQKEIVEINDIFLNISKHVRFIEYYQEQLKSILNEMHQGILLFNEQNELLFFNHDSRQIFKIDEAYYKKPMYQYIRQKEMRDLIEVSQENKENKTAYIQIGKDIFLVQSYHLNQKILTSDDATLLIVLRDVTEALKIEQMKKDFFSHASHELKSPLTAIRGYAELIEHHILNEQDVSEVSRFIGKQVMHMNNLVEDMLMLSKLETIKEKSNQSINSTDILKQVIEDLSVLISQRKIEIIKEIDDTAFIGDLLDLQKLYKNLIENAIKYSHEGGRIIVRLFEEQGDLCFVVEDFGIGIDKVYQTRIFERFFRVDKGRKDGGTGLGLAIVKHIVIKYEGQITLKSELDKGTLVKVVLKK